MRNHIRLWVLKATLRKNIGMKCHHFRTLKAAGQWQLARVGLANFHIVFRSSVFKQN